MEKEQLNSFQNEFMFRHVMLHYFLKILQPTLLKRNTLKCDLKTKANISRVYRQIGKEKEKMREGGR
jgi:hypothetical protein